MTTMLHTIPILIALLVCAYLALASRWLERRRKQHWIGILKDCAGALLPAANTTVAEGGGSSAPDTDLIAVFSVMQQGTPVQSGGILQLFQRASDIQGNFGLGEGLEFCAHYFDKTKKPILFGSMPIVTAGALVNTDVTHVTGTSVVTFTGTPFDDENIQVNVVDDGASGAGGTIGTAGIIISVSRDGGRTFGPRLRLGTATSYVIPNTGVTVNFAAGTLKTNDYATVVATSPKWDANGLTACVNALINRTDLPRAVIIIGDCANQTLLNAVVAAAQAYYAANRYARFFANFRDYQPRAVAQYAGATVTTNQAGKTYTRSTGSFVTDGFFNGGKVVFGGFANSASNGVKTIVSATATVITVSEVIGATETTVAGTTAVETETTITSGNFDDSIWRTAYEAVVGSTPSTQIVEARVVFPGGRARKPSPTLDGGTKRRPASWWILLQWMLHDVQISPAEPDVGAIPNVSLTDLNGNLEDHDERVMGGLLAMRGACLRTFSEKNLAGVYCALPLTLDNDNAPLSRVQNGGVADIACTIVQAETARRLNAPLVLNTDGTLDEAEAQRIEEEVLSALKAELLTRKKEGQRASSVTFQLQRGVVLTNVGAVQPTLTNVVPLGYPEQISNKVLVQKAS